MARTKKQILSISLLLLQVTFLQTIRAQTYEYHWQYQSNYSSTMTISTTVSLDGEPCVGSQWECAAFIDNECRHTSFLSKAPAQDLWVCYLSVKFNQEDIGKNTSFRIYNHQENKEYEITLKIPAEVNADYGLNPPDYAYFLLNAIRTPTQIFSEGEGTPESPYLLRTRTDLDNFAKYSDDTNSKVCVRLAQDIDMGNAPWIPAGIRFPFSGTFDGGGHTLSNLKIDNNHRYTGLFAQMDGTLTGLKLVDGYARGNTDNYTGLLVGYSRGIIRDVFCENCTVVNTGDGISGGLVGCVYEGEITRSAFIGTVTANNYCGGLFGENALNFFSRYTIDQCYFYGQVNNATEGKSGGIIGIQRTTLGESLFYTTDDNTYRGYGAKGDMVQGIERYRKGRTKDEFKKGEIAFKMDWGQKLGEEIYPLLNNLNDVYQIRTFKGSPVEEITYVNTAPTDLPEGKNHLYFCEKIIPGFTGSNIICKYPEGYYCLEFVINDEEPFYNPTVFVAGNATYTRHPKVWADGANGWETIVLPFAADSYTASLKGAIVPFWNSSVTAPSGSSNLNKNGAFWLKQYTRSEVSVDGSGGKVYFDYLRQSPCMKANVPYIIAFPGDTFGSRNSLQGQSITFSAAQVPVPVTPTDGSIIIGNFGFKGVYTPINSTSHVLNKEGNLFTSVLEGSPVLPFRSYFEVYRDYPQSWVKSLSIGSDNGGASGFTFAPEEDDAFLVEGKEGCVVVRSVKAMMLTLVGMDGRVLRNQEIEPGITVVSGMPRGVCLVNGVKVIVR